MTVCVAAICEKTHVVGLADKMLSTDDVQVQPQQSKIVRLTSSVFAMYAGDVALATELLAEITTEPQNWWLVADVAELWRDAYIKHRAKRAEATILAPLGLTSDTFISRQKELSDSFVSRLTTELVNFGIDGVSVIFGGIDSTGPHLYLATNADIGCCDGIGFIAIGSGSYHARSQMLFAGHTASASLSRGMASLYMAKRRAEVAPGVGDETDSAILLTLGQLTTINDEAMVTLRSASDEEMKKVAEAFAIVEGKLNETLKQIVARNTPEKAAQQVADGSSSADDEGAGGQPTGPQVH